MLITVAQFNKILETEKARVKEGEPFFREQILVGCEFILFKLTEALDDKSVTGLPIIITRYSKLIEDNKEYNEVTASISELDFVLRTIDPDVLSHYKDQEVAFIVAYSPDDERENKNVLALASEVNEIITILNAPKPGRPKLTLVK